MTSNSMVLASIINILYFPRQQFGYSLTLKSVADDEDDGRVAMLSVQSPYPGNMASIVLRTARDRRTLALVKTLSMFSLTPCSIDDTRRHLQMCETGRKQEMQCIQKTHAVDKARAEWHAREFERYQARRVAMGLQPLTHRSQRSHWDEEMRLAYIEKFDGTAYQKQRAKDIEDQLRDFRKIDEEAWTNVTTCLNEDIDMLVDELESVTITDMNMTAGQSGRPSNADFNQCLNAILDFYLNACKGCVILISDASSGMTWRLDDSGMFSRVAPRVTCYCTLLNYAPRGTRRTAAQRFSDPRHSPGNPALLKLNDIALNDADTERATRRFYSGCTFIQYVLGGFPDVATDRDAIALACNSDLDGECVTPTNGRRPVFFVLAQVILNLTIERAIAGKAAAATATAMAAATTLAADSDTDTDIQHTLDIYNFFDALWRDYVLKSAVAVDSRAYRFKGMTVQVFIEVFKTTIIDLFGDTEMFTI